MAHFDIFNGDADGLCALQQLRLAHPTPDAHLVTGTKRDICLLEHVSAQPGDTVTVFDISIARNREALLRLLNNGVLVEYFDHHAIGAPIEHQNLRLHVDLSAEVCTSLLVDRRLNGRFSSWAIVGAFGDGLIPQATRYAGNMGLSQSTLQTLRRLGELLNYNSYGDAQSDLLYSPAYLRTRMANYVDPMEFIARQNEIVQSLAMCYVRDVARMSSVLPMFRAGGVVFQLPEESWCQRVSGLLANQARSHYPNQAVAVIRRKQTGSYIVSVRAPRGDGADRLCAQFPSGGGRRSAAGINDLPAEQLDTFFREFDLAFQAKQVA
jgi:hypothetical protein